jgi:hypothetical protein
MTEETGLTVPETNIWQPTEQMLYQVEGLDAADLLPDGIENLKERDFAPLPRWKLVQGTSTFEGVDVPPEPGTWFHTGTKRSYPVLHFAGLKFLNDTYAWFVEPYDPSNPPYCYSDDGINPAIPTDRRPMLDRQPGPCATCPKSQWGDNDESPLCAEQRNLLIAAVDQENGLVMPGQLTLRRSMMRAARELTSHMGNVGLMAYLVGVPYDYTNPKGMRWKKPAFGIGKAFSEGAIREMVRLKKVLVAQLEAGDLVVEAEVKEVNGDAGPVKSGPESTVDTPPPPEFDEDTIPF